MAMRNPHVRIGHRSSFMLHYAAMSVYWSISYFIHADFFLKFKGYSMTSHYLADESMLRIEIHIFSALHHVFIQFKTSWKVRRTFHFIISKSEETCFFWIFANQKHQETSMPWSEPPISCYQRGKNCWNCSIFGILSLNLQGVHHPKITCSRCSFFHITGDQIDSVDLFSWFLYPFLCQQKLLIQWQLIIFEATSSSSCRHPIFNLKKISWRVKL